MYVCIHCNTHIIHTNLHTELLWEALSTTMNTSLDDQVKLNHALNDCDIQWIDSTSNIMTKAVEGMCARNKLGALKVTILPHSVVCRQCLRGHRYFVWHTNSKKNGKTKVAIAKSQGLWFLKKNWKDIGVAEERTTSMSKGMSNGANSARLTGIAWLKAISNFSTWKNIAMP